MSDIQRTCPQCQSVLEVPVDSIGRQAQCPVCQHVFEVTDADANLPDANVPDANVPETSPPSSSSASTNPYRPSPSGQTSQPRSLAPVQIRTPEPAEFINAAWSLFRSGWRPLVAAGTVAFVLNAASTILGTLLTIAAQESGNPIFSLFNVGIRVPLGLVYFFVMMGILRMSVDLARGRMIRFGQTFQTRGRVFVRALLGYFLLIAPMMLIVVPIGLAGVGSGFDPNAMVLAGVVCLLPLIVLVTLLFFYLWSYLYLLADREIRLFASLRLAFQIGRVNKMNSLILMLLSMGLSTAGLCACFVGQVVSTPAIILLAAVAYLQMTDQPLTLPAYPPPVEGSS